MNEPQLDELKRESTMGGIGTEVDRPLPVIDLSHLEQDREQVAERIWAAASEDGFFQIVGHGIEVATIERAFDLAELFFELPAETKAKFPLLPGTNAGWEFKSQVRPSTGTNDEKESYQITRPRMDDLWPSDEELAGFRDEMLAFEEANWTVAMNVLSCLADGLGFEPSFFTERHDPTSPDYQSTLRILHYLPSEPGAAAANRWRAGAHTDFDCLTLLHQRTGQGGLQLCPGAAVGSNEWTPVEPKTGVITCNIGDMLMRWSDDRLSSTLHRVRVPDDEAALAPRYSIAFFAQADRNVEIVSPNGKYEPMTAAEYLHMRIAANFAG